MLRSSIPLLRLMGVDVRLHLSFPALFVAAIAYGMLSTGSAMRGIGLFVALMLAVLVRETARAIAAAWLGLRLRALFLLPIGGVMAFAPQPAVEQTSTRALMLAAPLANIAVGLLILGLCWASAPGVQMFAQPWISPAHLLRSFVWIQFLLAALNLLPTAAMPTRQMLRGAPETSDAAKASPRSPVFGIMAGLAIALMLAGFVTANILLLIVGGFALFLSQMRSRMTVDATTADGTLVHEVMLTDCVLLSSSDTLRGALGQTVHSLQDVFPVVRGDRLVGSVSRQTLSDQLQSQGDGYLQGLMSKGLQTAAPQELLSAALRRAASQGASEFIPVVDDGRMLGILTPQSLGRAVQQVRMMKPPAEAREPRP